MRILLSNDDGVHAPGMQRWRKRCVSLLTYSRSPDRNRSGASNSHAGIFASYFYLDNGDIAVQMGTPTDCVYLR